MKFNITFKNPDCISTGIEYAVKMHTNDIEDEEQLLQIQSDLKDELNDFISKWTKYGEYITIEFDTEKNSAIVVPKN